MVMAGDGVDADDCLHVVSTSELEAQSSSESSIETTSMNLEYFLRLDGFPPFSL